MKRSELAHAQIDALLDLWKGLPEVRVVLVGAAALAAQMDMRWRCTNDLDVSVVAEQSDLERRLRGLGWEPRERVELRWTSNSGAVVDVIPVALSSLAARQLVFPRSGHVMSLVGFDLALQHVTRLQLEGNFAIEMAIVPVIAILKMTAWLDRPWEREKDLHDIAHILTHYLEPDDMRRWDDSMIHVGLPYEQQGAFGLGQDIAAIVGSEHRVLIERFLAAVSDEALGHAMVFGRCFGMFDGWHVAEARLDAFRCGLGCRTTP